ncbi:uncharacterized protein [Elaeis guineensis]|uniref:uncharacterized protein isoform X3 n=1 Tax=Elaeis guineensis var. tenera TaxID=51953 RepID=UPI003C6D406A
MEASSIPLSLVCLPQRRWVSANPNARLPRFSRSKCGVGHARAATRVHAMDGAADLGPTVELTWQVAVGALAGITPFVVAGIEFGKRIVQRRIFEISRIPSLDFLSRWHRENADFAEALDLF